MDEDNSKLLPIGTSSFTVASCGEYLEALRQILLDCNGFKQTLMIIK